MRNFENTQGIVFDIQRFSVHDGPGIRTTIFLKGCPLTCLWCHNPESQSILPVLSFEKELCVKCGLCVKACPNGVHALLNDTRILLREKCKGCGNCVEACNTNALVLKGQKITVKEVMDEVLKDKLFYRKSGGGITLSGGEPLLQPTFTYDLLKTAKRFDLHTAIETCGYAKWTDFQRILKVADLFMYDLKHMETNQHRKFIGVDNTLILKNLHRIVKNDKEVLIRIPLIPGINDGDKNLQKSAEFIKRLGKDEVEFIPYHEFASTKYDLIGRQYTLHKLQPYTLEQLGQIKEKMENLGIKVNIGV